MHRPRCRSTRFRSQDRDGVLQRGAASGLDSLCQRERPVQSVDLDLSSQETHLEHKSHWSLIMGMFFSSTPDSADQLALRGLQKLPEQQAWRIFVPKGYLQT